MPRQFYACLSKEHYGLGLDLFFRYLKPAQTEDVLRAILNLVDGHGQFLSNAGNYPEAREHFQSFR